MTFQLIVISVISHFDVLRTGPCSDCITYLLLIAILSYHGQIISVLRTTINWTLILEPRSEKTGFLHMQTTDQQFLQQFLNHTIPLLPKSEILIL